MTLPKVLAGLLLLIVAAACWSQPYDRPLFIDPDHFEPVFQSNGIDYQPGTIVMVEGGEVQIGTPAFRFHDIWIDSVILPGSKEIVDAHFLWDDSLEAYRVTTEPNR